MVEFLSGKIYKYKIMSRTYRKVIKCGRCTGSNTEYYRDMNRKCRNRNNHELRNLMANYDIDEVDDMIMTHIPIRDNWNEPTDGTFLVDKKDKNFYKYEEDGSITTNKHYGTGENYWNHKFGKYLKPKNRNHR